jgi:hypothetical protein
MEQTSRIDQRGIVHNLAGLARPIELNGSVADLLTLPFAAHRELPQSCQEIAVLRAAMNSSLLCDFAENWLSVTERLLLLAYNSEGFVPRSLREKWDKYLLKQAAPQYGARIFISEHVMARVWAWASGEERGTRKLREMFNQAHKSARVGLKCAKGSITPQARRARDSFIPEISELQRRLRAEWPDSAAEVRQFVAREIETSPPFFYLKRNAPQLVGFLGDDHIALAFRGEPDHIRVTPTQFFTKWLAASTNRSEESVRQDLTRQ